MKIGTKSILRNYIKWLSKAVECKWNIFLCVVVVVSLFVYIERGGGDGGAGVSRASPLACPELWLLFHPPPPPLRNAFQRLSLFHPTVRPPLVTAVNMLRLPPNVKKTKEELLLRNSLEGVNKVNWPVISLIGLVWRAGGLPGSLSLWVASDDDV